MILSTGTDLREIAARLHALFLCDKAGDTRLIELTQFVILFRIDLTEVTQIWFLATARIAIATAAFRANLSSGSNATVQRLLAIATWARPALLADTLTAGAIGTLCITVVALQAFTVLALVSRITDAGATVAFAMMRTNLIGQRGMLFIVQGATTVAQQRLICGGICSTCGTITKGARPALITDAVATVEITVIRALKAPVLIIWLRFLHTRTRTLQLHIDVHVLAQRSLLHAYLVALRGKKRENGFK